MGGGVIMVRESRYNRRQRLRREAILERYRQGDSVPAIARDFNCTPRAVYGLASRNGVRRLKRFRSIDLQSAADLYAAGYSIREVSAQLDICPTSVAYRLRIANVEGRVRHSRYRSRIPPLADQGLTSAEIGRRLGISQSFANRLVREYRAGRAS